MKTTIAKHMNIKIKKLNPNIWDDAFRVRYVSTCHSCVYCMEDEGDRWKCKLRDRETGYGVVVGGNTCNRHKEI